MNFLLHIIVSLSNRDDTDERGYTGRCQLMKLICSSCQDFKSKALKAPFYWICDALHDSSQCREITDLINSIVLVWPVTYFTLSSLWKVFMMLARAQTSDIDHVNQQYLFFSPWTSCSSRRNPSRTWLKTQSLCSSPERRNTRTPSTRSRWAT